MSRVRVWPLFTAVLSGVVVLVGAGLAVVLHDPVTREPALSFLDDLHLYGPRTRLWREAQELAKRDAEADARVAVAEGDSRLLGMAALGSFLPGTEHVEYQALFDRFGARFLASGCEISSPEEGALHQAKANYAARYNREVLSLTKVAADDR
jgi:hypothetical protein